MARPEIHRRRLAVRAITAQGSLAQIAPLMRGGHRDLNVLAVLMCESALRSRQFRFAEYFFWFFVSLIVPARAHRLSIGIAQLQLRHWVDLGLLDGTTFSFRRASKVASLQGNYEAVRRFLLSRSNGSDFNPRSVAAIYHGEARSYYVSLLSVSRDVLENRSRGGELCRKF